MSALRGLVLSALRPLILFVLQPRTPPPIEQQIRRGLRDRDDGWWVRLVLDAFGYLESDFGYTLVGVFMHFKGNGITYRGPVFELTIAYDPESTGTIDARLHVAADMVRDVYPRTIDVNSLLRVRDPALPLPETSPLHLDRATVSEAVLIWARGLRELAPDVLAGAWPEGIAGR